MMVGVVGEWGAVWGAGVGSIHSGAAMLWGR